MLCSTALPANSAADLPHGCSPGLGCNIPPKTVCICLCEKAVCAAMFNSITDHPTQVRADDETSRIAVQIERSRSLPLRRQCVVAQSLVSLASGTGFPYCVQALAARTLPKLLSLRVFQLDGHAFDTAFPPAIASSPRRQDGVGTIWFGCRTSTRWLC